MREDWKEIKMVDACEILTCGVASTPKYVDENVGVPFLSAQNVKNGEIVLDKYKHISQEFHEHLTKKNKPQKGDILYSRVGAKYGEAGVVEHDFEFSVYVSVTLMRPKPELFNNYYFKYYLNSPRIKELAKRSIQSSGVPNLNVKVVREFPVPIPPLEEQKQIVAILDKAFKAIDQAKANIEKNIENAKELFDSKREDFFINAYEISGNKSDILKNICTIKTGKLNANAMVENGKYPFFTCSREIYKIDNFAFDTEAVLLAGNNASGDFNVKYYSGKFNAYQRTYVITIDNEDLTYSFLKHKLEHNLQAFKRQSVGANTRFLKIGMINNLEIPLPKIDIQKELCENLDSLKDNLDTIVSSYELKVDSLEELKKSILQKAFVGELTENPITV